MNPVIKVCRPIIELGPGLQINLPAETDGLIGFLGTILQE
jgi:hypothetical protein